MIFRILVGLYLIFHFINIVPYAEELFGYDMMFDPHISPIYGFFPNILDYINATFFIYILVFLSVLLTIEYFPRLVSFLLWYGWVALFNRNMLILNPGLPYIGWILLALTLVEEDKNRKLFHTNNTFLKYIQRDKFPKRIFWCGWILMAAGYTCSGLHKLVTSPSWTEGTALQFILESCLARDNFLRDLLLQFPFFLKLSTWGALFLEIAFLPLGVFYHTRFYFWIIYMLFHFGILLLINFTDLTIGMTMIHLFTFDWRWTENINNYISDKYKNKYQ